MLAVFGDGASLTHMQLTMLETDEWFNLRELFLVLTEKVGTEKKLAFQPMITVPDVRSQWAKALRTAGFRTHQATSRGARDDSAIIDAINALDETVTEIVILTADQDYVQALRKQAERGVKVYWVATRMLKKGRLSISAALNQLFERGEFTFVELAQFIDELQVGGSSSFELELKLSLRGNPAHGIVIAEVERLVSRIPGLSYTIERFSGGVSGM